MPIYNYGMYYPIKALKCNFFRSNLSFNKWVARIRFVVAIMVLLAKCIFAAVLPVIIALKLHYQRYNILVGHREVPPHDSANIVVEE